MRKVIGITGAAGNIGKTLQEGLSSKYDLKLYDIKEINSENFIKVDFSDKKSIEGIFNGLNAIIHLAADAGSLSPAIKDFCHEMVSFSIV